MSGPEKENTEEPFIEQLISMGWEHTTGNIDHPTVTGRESFKDVFFRTDLEAALVRINEIDGEPWLDDARVEKAIHDLEHINAGSLLEANKEATTLLLKGTEVESREADGRPETIQYIDWENPENNTFRVVDQFRIDCPAGQPKKYIQPDLVLFVNGIPLVVTECKAPSASAPEAKVGEAIDQLQRYANRRRALGIVEVNEGQPRLFHTNQFVVATCFNQARVGTFTSLAEHFLEWKDTSPVPMADIEASLGVDRLSSQQALVAGMLRPAHLLDIVRHFTLFHEISGKEIKLVCRYQQFRATQLAIQRLLTGKTREEDGDTDQRGGIIWHTQGSGKSLTMVFLIRKMRSNDELKGFKVVVVTDRRSLQKQLAETAVLVNEPLEVVKAKQKQLKKLSGTEVLKKTLSKPGKDLVFVMMQKFRGQKPDLVSELDEGDDEVELEDDEGLDLEMPDGKSLEPLLTLNVSDKILVLIDEAHRSQGNKMHANLLNALPNCAKIGFTGTPIIMGKQKRTKLIFGDYIDKYTIRQSEADGATVPVQYEGRVSNAVVKGGGSLDQKYENMLHKWTPKERERIKAKYGTKSHVMEAEKLIAAKARSMIRHYTAEVLPNGFKAQVVAVSRRATIRYRKALMAARDELVKELDELDDAHLALSEEELRDVDPEIAFLVNAHPWREKLKEIEFAPVISGGHQNDKVDPGGTWSAPNVVKANTERFKRPLFHKDPDKRDNLAFIIVKSMLLTGFDAPIAQVMYLDRNIYEADLLQAIARVNRTYATNDVVKTRGIVVDFYGVSTHLEKAVERYDQEAQQEILETFTDVRDDIPLLDERYRKVIALLSQHVDDTANLGDLTSWHQKQLAKRFCQWTHPRPKQRPAKLGDGSEAAAARVLAAMERFLLAPTPGDSDPYRYIQEHIVAAIKALLSAAEGDEPAKLVQPFSELLLQIEASVFKLLALFEPEKFEKLSTSQKGLAAGIASGLIPAKRSRYTLKLSDEQFKDEAGWVKRNSYENAVYDSVKNRNFAAHGKTGEIEPERWESALVMLLGLLDHNLESLETLPPVHKSEIDDVEKCVRVLRDEVLRDEYKLRLREFLRTLDDVLPRREALPYVDDAKVFSHIQAEARNRYRAEERLIGEEVGAKIRKLIDEHIESRGIAPGRPPISVTDPEFVQYVHKKRSKRAQASEMEHAIRHECRRRFEEDPEFYRSISEHLERILKELNGRFEEMNPALEELVARVQEGRQQDDTGLDPETEARFYDRLRKRAEGELHDEANQKLIAFTVELVAHLRQELSIDRFWKRPQARLSLRNWVYQQLDRPEMDGIFEYEKLEEIATLIMELAESNHERLVS